MAESVQRIRDDIEATKSQMISKLHTLEEKLSFGEQIHKHPWLSLGSAAAIGYLSAHFRTGRSSRKNADQAAKMTDSVLGADGQETSVVGDTVVDAIPATPPRSKWSLSSSIAQSTKAIVAQIVIEAAQRAVAQAVPLLIARSLHGASHARGQHEANNSSSVHLNVAHEDAEHLERTRGIA